MPTLVVTKLYEDGTTPTESQLDGIRDSLALFLNVTRLDGDNFQASAVTSAKYEALSVTAAKLDAPSVTAVKITDACVTRAKLADLSESLSTSTSSGVTMTSGTLTDVTSLSCSLTTSGRPVWLALVAADDTNTARIYLNKVSSGTNGVKAVFRWVRDSTNIARLKTEWKPGSNVSTYTWPIHPGSLFHIDTPSAGTYTYKLQCSVNSGENTCVFQYVRLVAFEL